MKTLIVYSTKSGAAKEYAEMLAAKIENSTVCDLDKKMPNIRDFEMIIAGSGIRMGKAYKPFRSFLMDNTGVLLSRKTAFFLCGMTPGESQKDIEKNIPGDLRAAAVCVRKFGGKQPFGKPADQSWMSMEEIEEFAQLVNKTA